MNMRSSRYLIAAVFGLGLIAGAMAPASAYSAGLPGAIPSNHEPRTLL